MEKTARFYNCVCCFKHTVICSNCDRGNIYCKSICSRQTRLLNHRKANQKYQLTLKGRQKHAERQRRYRKRQNEKKNKVTDQGSADLPLNDLLPNESNEDQSQQTTELYCHFCGGSISPFLRNGFLQYDKEKERLDISSWPQGP